MFDHIKSLLKKHGHCTRFICKCHPEMPSSSHPPESFMAEPMTELWLEGISLRLATFWAFSEREFLVQQLERMDDSGTLHVKWLSRLLSAFCPSQSGLSQPSPAERSRPIGDLTRKGRRNSMIQLERDWNGFTKQSPSPQPQSSQTREKLDHDAGGGQEAPVSAMTPTSVARRLAAKQAEEEKLQQRRDRFRAVNQARLAGILPHLTSEAKEVAKNCAHVMRVNGLPPETVERELELHYPHGDVIDTKLMKHVLKLFGRKYSSTGEVLHVFRFLQQAVDNVSQGLLEHQEDNQRRSRSAVLEKKKYPLWRDLLLVVSHFYHASNVR